jgi:DNA repair exonuclease SbcCD ATPase subunit
MRELRDQLAGERSASKQTAASIEALKAEVEQLGAFRAQDAAAAEQAHAADRDELAGALEQRAAALAALDAAHSARDEEAKVTKALRARVAELEQTVREDHVSSVAAADAEVEALRAVVELQEQAIAGAEAREQALRDTPPSPADSPGRRMYSETSHFLFAPGAEGYELFERSGIAPAVGAVIDLSGGRQLRVVRLGPAPYPGAREACAYLENA